MGLGGTTEGPAHQDNMRTGGLQHSNGASSHHSHDGHDAQLPEDQNSPELLAVTLVPVYGTPPSVESSKWDVVKQYNVASVLAFCFIDGSAYSVWNQQVYQVLIEQLGGDTAVGWMSAASGVAQMVAAVIAGFVGDRLKRQTVLRVGACAGFIAVIITFGGLHALSLAALYVGQVMWGTYSGIAATGTEAIFADSVATGRRAFVYNLKWMDQTLSSVTGLLVTIALLMHMGNRWEQSSMIKTMVVGLCIHPIAMLTLCTLKDKYTLKEEEGELRGGTDVVVVCDSDDSDAGVVKQYPGRKGEEDQRRHDESELEEDIESAMYTVMATANDGPMAHVTVASSRRTSDAADGLDAGNEGNADKGRQARDVCSGSPVDAAISAAASPTSGNDDDFSGRETIRRLQLSLDAEKEAYRPEHQQLTGMFPRMKHAAQFYMHLLFTWEAVPYLVCLVDFLIAFGSGMTMRFLPLFFVNNYHTTPAVLMTAHLLMCPLQAALSYAVQYFGGLYVGRLASTIIARLIGTFLMLLMGVTHLPLYVLLPIYVFRNSMMNSTRGVTRSIIMDAVKKKNRAKWSAFESFSSFTWAGSATIGGYIAAAKGYQYSFTITALFHFCALAVLIPAVFGSRPVEEALMRGRRARRDARKARSQHSH